MFDWGTKDAAPTAPRVDEHDPNFQPNTTPTSGAVSDHTRGQARENAVRLSGEKSKRGRAARGDAGTGSDDSRALQAKVDAEIARQLDALHDPKAWAALCCFPADTALTLTGRAHWETSSNERATVGATGSALARTLMITNPRALALMMFSASMLSMYMPRVIKEMEHLRGERAAAKKKEEKKPDEKT
jgi:hypothetical protein